MADSAEMFNKETFYLSKLSLEGRNNEFPRLSCISSIPADFLKQLRLTLCNLKGRLQNHDGENKPQRYFSGSFKNPSKE